MESVHSKPRMSDRLSMLSDDLIHKILSFTSSRNAVQTSALSSRWRFIWTSMPYLNFSYEVPRFSDFVNHVLSSRNDQLDVYSVNLSFCQSTYSDELLKRVLDYAFSHNVQRLTLTITLFASRVKDINFPLSLFRSQSLKYLSLTGTRRCIPSYPLVLASTWELPALTTLCLDYVTFNDNGDDLGYCRFTKFVNLKNLTLSHFAVTSSNYTVYHPQLCNLTLESGHWTLKDVSVVAPQLQNLTIKNMSGKHLITAPNLASLVFRGSGLLQFSSDLPSLEKVDLCITSTDKWSGGTIFGLLQSLCHVKSLTLNSEFVEFGSSYLEGVPSPFSNLKSLKIYPAYIPSDDEAHKKVNMSSEVINFLLDGSPSATLTLISYEEIKEKMKKARALANAVKAQKLMKDLQVMLEREKATIRIQTDRPTEADAHDPWKASVEKMQLHFEMKMEHMKSCWEDAGVQMDRGRQKTRDIISRLRNIEVLLLEDIPTSKRDELQACFFSLRAEANAVVKKILHELSGSFSELATILLP